MLCQFGRNNNPTPYQFKGMFRRILCGATDQIIKDSNVSLQDDTEMVAVIPNAENKIDFIYAHYDFDDIDIENLRTSNLDSFSDNVVEYMSGYVVKRICEKLTCEDCKKSLKGDPRQGGLISTRQFDSAPQGLVFPSRFVFKALCIAESVLRCELEKDWLGKKYFFDYVNIKICNSFVSIHSIIMKKMDNHCYDLLKEQHDESSFLRILYKNISLRIVFLPRNMQTFIILG